MFNLIDKLQWRIGKRAAREVLDGFEYEAHDPTENAMYLAGELCGYSAVAGCYFKKRFLGRDSLVNVIIVLPAEGKMHDLTAKQVFKSVQSSISDRIGQPDRDVDATSDDPPEVRISRVCFWKRDDTVITLVLRLKRDGCVCDSPVLLRLGHATDDPFSREWESLYE
jgi:hypothetical protein